MSNAALAEDQATAAASELIARGAITEADVLRLRREVFADGRVGPREAQLIFALDQACGDRAPGWGDLYVEALTDHFVRHAEPEGYVDEASGDPAWRELFVKAIGSRLMFPRAAPAPLDAAEAAWLIVRLNADGVISPNERALLAFVKETAAEIDESLRTVMDKAGI